jgi:hypothetical protein
LYQPQQEAKHVLVVCSHLKSSKFICLYSSFSSDVPCDST